MAKDKRPINVQVAEMTAEQRKTVLRIGVWTTVVSLLLFAVILVVALIPMLQTVSDSKVAKENYYDACDAYDAAEAEWEAVNGNSLLSFMSTQSGSQLWAEREAAFDAWNEVGEDSSQKLLVSAVALGIYVVIAAVGFLFIFKKFPYYGDRKYYYILFHRKELV